MPPPFVSAVFTCPVSSSADCEDSKLSSRGALTIPMRISTTVPFGVFWVISSLTGWCEFRLRHTARGPRSRSLSADADTVKGMTTRGFRMRAERAVDPGRTALDGAQAEVLGLPDGASAAVIGAPGTGKTTTLVEAIAERVHGRGYATHEVLALSASRTSATALRDRIALRLDVPTNGPLARTATSLAFQLVGERARRSGQEPPRLLTGGEQDQIIAELLNGHIEDGTGPAWPEPLVDEVRALRGFRTELRELMARCAERGVSPSRLSELGAITGHDEWRAAARFIAEYQAVVDSYRGGFVDSAELIASAVTVVRGGSSLDGLRAIFVDDLQEATVATVALLRALSDRGVAVVAFGDPDVASTTFRGAETTALGQLESRLGVPVTRFVLTTAHRQTPALRELTARVTERIGTAAAGVQRVAAAGRPEPEPEPVQQPAQEGAGSVPRSCASSRRLRPPRPRVSPASCANGTCSTACRGATWPSSSAPARTSRRSRAPSPSPRCRRRRASPGGRCATTSPPASW